MRNIKRLFSLTLAIFFVSFSFMNVRIAKAAEKKVLTGINTRNYNSNNLKQYRDNPILNFLKEMYDVNKAKDINKNSHKKIEVGMLTDQGGLNDQSFNQCANKGLLKAMKEFNLDYKVIESTMCDDFEANLETLAQNCDLTIGIGFMMNNPVTNVSSKYKNKKFAIIDSSVNCPNVMSITFKEEEGSFLMGVIAGKMTKTNKVAFIGGKEGALINKFEAGFVAGVKAVNEEAASNLINRKTVKYADSFSDCNKGYELTKVLIEEGCDVFYHAAGGVGIGMFQAIKEARDNGENIWAIGVDSDQGITMPKYSEVILSSMVKKIDTASYLATKNVVDNTFKGGIVTLGLKEDGVGYAESSKVNTPKEVLQIVEKYKKAIADGMIKVPANLEELKNFKKPEI
ncbi:BMP family lipoprotein [Clostridium ganghwense]|uniref:BMP family ABC transporter substrate-binding protein n=1 Tax=Clostridium ganghwense TaxID=312089 RepID=A0ABT4CSE6_9CLOT|nr:BMP family ABC transporter substrate-binding protein [Clostridium ganghwense]MCY6371995.1 BMP family ABC transporter substrate-binding protein [Clostridium ganghwense]